MTAPEIETVFRNHYRNRFQEVGLFGFSPGEGIFDVFIIAPHRRIFKGFEIKISHSDFLREKKEARERYFRWGDGTHLGEKKGERYLRYCHLFYYVCPEGIIQPEEVDSPAGLLWVSPKKSTGYLYSYFSVKKRPKRNPGPDAELCHKILFLFAARTKTRAGDYF